MARNFTENCFPPVILLSGTDDAGGAGAGGGGLGDILPEWFLAKQQWGEVELEKFRFNKSCYAATPIKGSLTRKKQSWMKGNQLLSSQGFIKPLILVR